MHKQIGVMIMRALEHKVKIKFELIDHGRDPPPTRSQLPTFPLEASGLRHQ